MEDDNISKTPTKELDKTSFNSWDDEDLNLKQKLLRGIYSYGFEQPSPIQKEAIIPLINRKDIIAQAQSGTVKLVLLS